jgi:Cdc6-like AAA superfamily ATPase
MSNPKDWFRRRRHDPLEPAPTEAGDPFAGDTVLDLGRVPSLLELDRSLAVRSPATGLGVVARGIGPVPPPPPRSMDLGGKHVLEAGSFSRRPELIVADGPEAAREAARRTAEPEPRGAPPTAPGLVEASHPVAAHAGGKPGQGSFVRSRAVPLVRPPAPPERPRSAPPPAPAAAPMTAVPAWSPTAAPPAARAELPPAPHPAGDARPANGDMPGFTLAAPGIPWMQSRPRTEGAAVSAALREAFTPTRPKQQGPQFAGRYKQLQRIIAAIEEERAHIVLYGERGSGKTSLSNIVAAKATEAGYLVVKFACSTELTFDDIFHSFLRQIPATFLADGIGATTRAGIDNFDELLRPGEIAVADLINVLGRLHDKHAILVVDEYDRIASAETKNKLAELIKNMSDASVPATILIIGVAEDVDDLLGKHPSLQRALVTIPLPLMAARELEGIIAAGEAKSGLAFAPAVRSLIVELAQGLPYHAQLLGLFAARSAARRHAKTVEQEDLRYAVERAAEEAEGKIKEAYNLAITSQSGTSFKDVIFAAARARSDEFGSFTVADVARAATEFGWDLSLLSLQFPLKKLSEPARGAVLRRINTVDGLRYAFVSQMVRHHVLVRQAVERGIV